MSTYVAISSKKSNGRVELALNSIPVWLSVIFFMSLVLLPEASSSAVKNGLKLCYERLLPTLFPFAVISAILTQIGGTKKITEVIGKPFSRLFGLSPSCASAFILGAVCGMPLGPRTAELLYENGEITKKELTKITALSCNAGIGFTVVGVGYGLWGSMRFGWLLYLIQIISVCISGAVFYREKVPTFAPLTPKTNKKAFFTVLCEAISKSAVGMLSVCAFVVFFNVLTAVVTHVASLIGLPPLFSAVLGSITEISSGCALLRELALSSSPAIGNIAKSLTFFAIGWSGICVHAQTVYTVEKSSPDLKKYFILKALTGIFCAVIGTTVIYFPDSAGKLCGIY